MCLTYDPTATEELAAKLARTGQLRLWKVMLPDEARLLSPFWNDYEWQPGVNVSNRHSKSNGPMLTRCPRDGLVNLGMHVYPFKADAIRECHNVFWSNCGEHVVAVPVTCSAEHFVAAGRFEYAPTAVFTRVHLSKHAYNQALRGK